MVKYLPAIQDEFRRRFPRLIQGEVKNIRVTATSPPEVSATPRFEFQNKDRTCGIVLQKDSLAVHVSRYNSFEEFCATIQYALDTVHSVVTLGLIERIGLRYINLVRPGEDEALATYLHPGLLGIEDSEVGVHRSLRMSMYQGETDSGTLVIRMGQRDDGGFLPPDIGTSTLVHVGLEGRPGTVVTLLDFDHYREAAKEPIDFSTDVVLRELWRLHDNTDLAFRAAVKQHALTAWGIEKSDAAS